MTMAVPMQPQKDVVPPCFGKEWDHNEPECAGGPDPNFQAADGGHIRPQCAVFARCGARTQAMKQATAPNVVPASSLTRPPMVTPPPQQAPRTWPDYIAQQAQRQNAPPPPSAWVERQRLEAMTAARPPLQPPMHSAPPTFQHNYPIHSPAVRYELNYTMPGYLTTPEERGQGESLLAVIFREIIRAIFKAVGHTVAHSFDTRTLKGPPPNDK